VLSLAAGQKTFFQNDASELMVNARTRYEQWAIANNDVAGKYVASGLGRIENNT
jgi:hypothetical protein